MGLNYRAIGTQIMVIRKRKHLSQASLSELIDKSPTYISHIETGKKSMSLETFVEIANALYVSADILLSEQLTGVAMADSQDITALFEDCSDLERLVITDTLISLKESLRKHSPMV